MSKGSKPRPYSVANDEYSNRWDAIFQRTTEEIPTEDQTAEDTAEWESRNPLGS